VAPDRSPSLQTMERRHDTSADDGNPTQLATGLITTISIGLSGTEAPKLSFDAPAAQQPRSQAQPRAPPPTPRSISD
jgi:hypothetical protein